VDERLEQARLAYERTVYDGDTGLLAKASRDLDGVEADLALARGRVMHMRFLIERDENPANAAEDPEELTSFERAAELYQALGDTRGEAEALFWTGCFHQVVRRDNDTAVPLLERSFDLAVRSGDKLTAAEDLRHLGIAAHAAGRFDAARRRLEESNQLRQEIGLLAGVASNLIGLAYIAAAQHRRDEAMTLLDEAAAIADDAGALRIRRTVSEARAELGPGH
jgi:tetratricopeptide (TPR) repeat protein